MVEVIVFAEGPTEEKFIKQLVAPALRHLQVFIKPQTLNTSQTAKGGAVTFDRLKFNARNTLRQHPDAVLSTFLDLYALDTDFPAFEEAKKNEIEDLLINDAFQLYFSSDQTTNFLDLVTKDISEEMEQDEEI